jgi:hypothetical protein
VHLQRDLLDYPGETWVTYMSEGSGGEGLMSTVAFVEARGAEALAAALQRFEARIDQAGREDLRGYVRLRRFRDGGASVTTLAFPGLPVPLEPSWTLAEGVRRRRRHAPRNRSRAAPGARRRIAGGEPAIPGDGRRRLARRDPGRLRPAPAVTRPRSVVGLSARRESDSAVCRGGCGKIQ